MYVEEPLAGDVIVAEVREWLHLAESQDRKCGLQGGRKQLSPSLLSARTSET